MKKAQGKMGIRDGYILYVDLGIRYYGNMQDGMCPVVVKYSRAN